MPSHGSSRAQIRRPSIYDKGLDALAGRAGERPSAWGPPVHSAVMRMRTSGLVRLVHPLNGGAAHGHEHPFTSPVIVPGVDVGGDCEGGLCTRMMNVS
jgi:hypothetical protein